ncbi:MAG: hypothetical protein LBU03_03240 [Tannerellaceae bacterium]|jgi:uncharacterized protein YjdB|nr:hypothetical protein [Tannerellaceae bacterium]
MKITLCRFFLCFAALLMAFMGKVGARVGYVPHSQESSVILSNELRGVSWDNPATLHEAILFANDSDRICLTVGEYESGATAQSPGFRINKSIYIEGGFLGDKSNSSRIFKDWLNGKAQVYKPRSTVNGRDNSRVFTVSGTGTKVHLTDISITGGNADAELIFPHCGGGLYIDKGTEVELNRTIVTGNKASSSREGKGGGIYVEGKLFLKDGRSEAFIDSTFGVLANAAAVGGPVFSEAVEGSAVSDNVATTADTTGMGGGIYIGTTGEAIIESRGLNIDRATGEYTIDPEEGGGWYVGHFGERSVETGVIFNHNIAIKGNGQGKGSAIGKGGAIYNKGTLHLKRGSAIFSNNIADSNPANTSDAYGGAIFFEMSAQTGGPIYFNGNRAKPENAVAVNKSHGHHVFPYHLVTFVDVDTMLLSLGEKAKPLAGASYIMTDNSFTFSLALKGLYERSIPRVWVNNVLLPKESSSTASAYHYKIENNSGNANVEEFKVAVKLFHPVHVSVSSALRRYLTLSPPFDENGNIIDTVLHGGTFKFTVTAAESSADDYFVIVNGRILDRGSSQVRQLAPNKYEYTISDFVTTAYTIAIASSVATIDMIFKAPPGGVSYLIDGEPLDFKGKADLSVPYLAGNPVYFIVKHDDSLFEPPAVRYNGVEIRRIFWEVPEERHFSVTTPAYEGGIISVDLPIARVNFKLTINPLEGVVYSGREGCLSYSITPPTTHIIPITCMSLDTSIAEIISVDASSRRICVMGKQVGKVSIVGQLGVLAGVRDTVEIEIGELSIGQGTLYMIKGSFKRLSSPVSQAEWSIENPEDSAIVTVTPEGELYGVSAGKAKVVYATGKEKWQIWTIHVLDKKNPGEQTVLQEKGTYSLRELFGIEEINQWESSDPLVAFVKKDTLYTSHYGKTTLYDAGAEGGLEVYVARIELKRNRLSSPVIGDTVYITDTVMPQEIRDRRLAWMTSRVSVAEIVSQTNACANVKMKATGEAYIQASLVANPEVNAVAYLSTLSAIEWLAPPPKFLVENEVVTLSATLNPKLPVDDVLVWDTVQGNNGRVEILSQTGQIKACIPGEGQIKVSSKANPDHFNIKTIPVVRIEFKAPSTTFAIGDIGTVTLQVQGRESGVDTLELVSSRPDVLTVSKSLVTSGERVFLTAFSPGMVTLTAQIKGHSNTKTTYSVQVVKLELPTKQIVVVKGDAPFSLMPKITPGNVLTWRSTNEQVASVQSHQGIVTPHNIGTAFIVAELYEKEGDDTPIVSASCQVTVVGETYVNSIVVGVAPEMTGLTVVAPIGVYEVGKSYQLAIEKDGEIITSSPEMTWESGVASNITINPTTGLMVPNVPGPASVKVTYSGIIKTYTFTVVAPSGGIKLKETELTLHEGEKHSIGYVLSPDGISYGIIRWTSSNKAVDVDLTGLVTANHYGEAYIKATLYHFDGSIVDSAFCKVRVASEGIGFALSDSERILEKKDNSFELRVNAMPPGIDIGRAYFVSDNPLVASVSMNGVANATITANNGGTADITVYVQGVPNLVQHCKVTVKSNPEKILLNYDTLTLSIGEKASISAWVFPVTAPQNHTLTSANPSISQISGNEVIALSVGTTKITAQTPNGRFSDLTLNVVPVDVVKKQLTLSDATLVLTRGQKYTILAYSQDIITDWAVSGSSTVIEHLGDGLIRAIAPGEATITATDVHGNKASCKITVNIFADRLIVYPYRPRILLVGEEFIANAVLEPLDIPLNEVVWVADNPSVVNLNQETALACRIIGMVEGVTLLSAQSADGKVINQWLLSVQKTRTGIEDIHESGELLLPSISYHADVLTLKNLAGHRVSLTTLSGRTLGAFFVDDDNETRSLSLSTGVYILTATHQSSRFVTKFVVR